MQFNEAVQYLQLGKSKPAVFVRCPSGNLLTIYPLTERVQGKVRLIGLSVDPEILAYYESDIRFASDVYVAVETALTAYFEIVWFDTDLSLQSWDALRNVLLLDLRVDEKLMVEQELQHFTTLYLIRDRDTGFTKIGRSRDPEVRLRQFQKQDTLLPRPNDFYILFTWNDRPERERELHELYIERRRRGEWFELTGDDITEIKRMVGHG